MKISDINIRIVKDSRNKDTLEAVLRSGDFEASASVPAGKSKGKFETTTLEPSLVLSKFETIKNQILNKDFPTVWEFDGFLISTDGTKEKSNLGGNLILVLSIAFTKLLAKSENLQCFQLISKILGKTPRKFPYLYFNLIGGGLHAKDSLPFQEYILVTKFPSPAKGLEYAKNCFEKLQEDIEKNFGHMMKAFSSGTPPHGGIAWGIDRIMMLLQNEPSIREVIAFPKTGDGRDLLMDSPSRVSDEQLKELGIEIKKTKK